MTDRPWRPAWGWLLLAAAVIVAVPALWLASAPEASGVGSGMRLLPPPPAPATVDAASQAAAPPSMAAPAPAIAVRTEPPPLPSTPPQRARDPNGDLSVDLADVVNPGEKPTMAEVIARLHQAGITTGLGAFQPPGTRPPLIGLAVPEDFALPPGYVRHHQATDDGQRIEAILMFAPGFQLFDSTGRPVAMPADRVVPPEMAPPGLPMRRIVVPPPLDPGK